MRDPEIDALAQGVAKHLDGFSASTNDDAVGVYLTHADGRQMFLHRLWNDKSRVTVTASYPREAERRYHFRDDGDRVSISVAMSRGAEVIAREITRRFLPAYDVVYAKVMEAARRHDEAAKDARTVAERFVAIAPELGLRITQGADSTQADLRWYDNTDVTGYGDITVNGGGSVQLTIRSLSAAAAEKMLAALAAHKRGE